MTELIQNAVAKLDRKYTEDRCVTCRHVETSWVGFYMDEDGLIYYEDDSHQKGGFESLNQAIEHYTTTIRRSTEMWMKKVCNVELDKLEIGWKKFEPSEPGYSGHRIGTITFVVAMNVRN